MCVGVDMDGRINDTDSTDNPALIDFRTTSKDLSWTDIDPKTGTSYADAIKSNTNIICSDMDLGPK
jgi:hypothetical protein